MFGSMRVVIDTSVLVAGLRSRLDASAAVLREIATKRLVPVASPALFLEYEAVLKREQHNLPPQFVDGFLAELAACIHPAEIWFLWRPQLPDAGDEMVLEAAINGQAEAIVTHNRRDFEPAAGKFKIAVMSPAELMQRLRPRGTQP
jgi:putative PIN family toxin of toxin-antitoxin system